MSNIVSIKPQFNTVHLVVDMQPMFGYQLSEKDQAELPGAIEAFVHETYKSIPPLYVESVDEDMWRADVDSSVYHSIFPRVFHPDIPFTKFGVISKRSTSAFEYGEHSDIHHMLQRVGANSLILSGAFTRACAWETAVDAAKYGYNVTIMEDLCRDSVLFKKSTHTPEVTSARCAAHGITLGSSLPYRQQNSGQFGIAAYSVATLRI